MVNLVSKTKAKTGSYGSSSNKSSNRSSNSNYAVLISAFLAGILFPILRGLLYRTTSVSSAFVFVIMVFVIGVFVVYFFQWHVLERPFNRLIKGSKNYQNTIHDLSLGIVVAMIFSLLWVIIAHIAGLEVISGYANIRFLSMSTTLQYILLTVINSVFVAFVLAITYQCFVFELLAEKVNWHLSILYTALFYALGSAIGDMIILPGLPSILIIGTALLSFFVMVLATFSYYRRPTIWVPFGVFFGYQMVFLLRNGVFYVEHNKIWPSLILAYVLVLFTIAVTRKLVEIPAQPARTAGAAAKQAGKKKTSKAKKR